MERDIKDYLHLYIGQRIFDPTNKSFYPLDWNTFDRYYDEDEDRIMNDIKISLRPLSRMSKSEAKEFCRLEGWGENLENIVVTDDAIDFKRVIGDRSETCISRFTRCRPEMFRWLLSKGFDLFSLIPDGLAIDATTISKTV